MWNESIDNWTMRCLFRCKALVYWPKRVLWSALDLKDATAPRLGHSNCCRVSKRATASIYALNAQFFRAKNVVQSQWNYTVVMWHDGEKIEWTVYGGSEFLAWPGLSGQNEARTNMAECCVQAWKKLNMNRSWSHVPWNWDFSVEESLTSTLSIEFNLSYALQTIRSVVTDNGSSV